MGERQFGPYRLVRQIAVGGMAEIHLAKATGIAGFEKYVAIKMIHPNFAEDDQFIQMLVDEAKIAVQLTHGNIAQTFDLGRVGDTYYITMEYVDGADLYKILRRASEKDIAMPLDVCAFVGKEISSALDHAHRKRDHTGKSLGIVHRDVSPQNVLVSYSGEVKLVDFGIAKAAMKVRQTAAGVIKGKYYYMSPEQAWGDPIDYRSDIFSAGIVLYEMITGQMLYLEEDLHKLLEMARSADIAPPSKLRRGVPAQLERIVMHALEKVPGERYQSAGDLATDLERFLHAYSPVFTASKLSTLLRQVVGDPQQVPDDPAFVNIEFRGGAMSTHPLDDAEVAHATDRAELRDENSVIFKVSELERPRPLGDRPTTPGPVPGATTPPPVARTPQRGTPHPRTPRPGTPPGMSRPGTPPPGMSRPGTPHPGTPHPGTPQSAPRPGTPRPVAASRPGATPRPVTAVKPAAPRITRPADPMPLPPRSSTKLPSITPQRPSVTPTPRSGQVMRPREPHEETRRLESPAPVDPLHDESSGLLMPDGSKLWDDADAPDDDLDNIGERTLITGAPMGGFMMDVEDQVEATLVTGAPTGPGFGGDEVEAASELTSEATANELTLDHHDDAPTLSREPAVPRAKSKAPPPAALAAKIHAPAVSELRKPRPSRRTPGTGAPTQVPNVLQAIVSSQVSEPMPAPRPTSSQRATGAPATPAPMMSPMMSPAPPEPAPRPSPVMPMSSPQASTLPESLSPFSLGTPDVQAPYSNDASGLPMTVPTPPGMPPQSAPGVPAHLQPYLHMQGMPPGSAHPPLATQMSPHGYPQLSPSALHQFQPPAPDMSLTSQMRLYEVDELPSQYKLVASRGRWFIYVVSGALAVMVAAAATFLIIRSIRDTAVRTGTLRIASVPEGATVWFDGAMLAEKTPFSVPKVTVGKPYQIKFELAGYRPHTETITMPRNGADYTVTAPLSVLVGKVIVNTRPPKAEVYIDDKLRTVSPDTVPNVPIETTNKIELRLKGYKSHVLEKKDLKWTSEGSLYIDKTLEIDPKSAR